MTFVNRNMAYLSGKNLCLMIKMVVSKKKAKERLKGA